MIGQVRLALIPKIISLVFDGEKKVFRTKCAPYAQAGGFVIALCNRGGSAEALMIFEKRIIEEAFD